MGVRKLFGLGVTGIMLLSLVGGSVYVAMQNQEIRQKAANDTEYMLVTPAGLRKNGKAQIAVVLNKLDKKFRYRLVFDLTYAPNQDNPPPASARNPKERKKTRAVSENKTYKYTFPVSDCRYIANITIQLYYRQTRKSWKPVDAPGTVGSTRMQIPCPAGTPTVTQPPASPGPEATASPTLTATETPLPTPTEDPNLQNSDPDAEDIDTLEDTTVLDQESAAAANEQASEQSSSPSPSSTPIPTVPGTDTAASATTTPTPSVTLSQAARATETIQETPTATPAVEEANTTQAALHTEGSSGTPTPTSAQGTDIPNPYQTDEAQPVQTGGFGTFVNTSSSQTTPPPTTTTGTQAKGNSVRSGQGTQTTPGAHAPNPSVQNTQAPPDGTLTDSTHNASGNRLIQEHSPGTSGGSARTDTLLSETPASQPKAPQSTTGILLGIVAGIGVAVASGVGILLLL